MIDWTSPYNGFWFLTLLAFIAVGYFLLQWRSATRAKLADPNLLEKLFPSLSNKRFYYKFFLTFSVLFLLIICLMQPSAGKETQELKREGIDFIIALDVSESMNAEDMAPSRLSKAKKIAQEIIKTRAGDRIGLVIFAGNAYALSPLTNDYSALETFMGSISTDLISFQGTNTPAALEEALSLFGNESTAKAILVISDGENHEEALDEAVEKLEERDVQVITVGIGNSKPVPIPVEEFGSLTDYKKDFYGETVLTKLEDETLKEIAERTNGDYIKAKSTSETVSELSTALNGFESTQYGSTQTQQNKPIYQWFLGFAILLLFIDSLTPEKRSIG